MGSIESTIMFIFNGKLSVAPVVNFPLPFPTPRSSNFNIIQKSLFWQQVPSVPKRSCFVRFAPTKFGVLGATSALYAMIFQKPVNCAIRAMKILGNRPARYAYFVLMANCIDFLGAKISFFHIGIISHITHISNKKTINLEFIS